MILTKGTTIAASTLAFSVNVAFSYINAAICVINQYWYSGIGPDTAQLKTAFIKLLHIFNIPNRGHK